MAGVVVMLSAAVLIPNFQNVEGKVPKETVADQADAGRDLTKTDGSGENDALPTQGKEMPKKPVAGSAASVQKEGDYSGICEETILLKGVPVHMRWQANEYGHGYNICAHSITV